MVFPIIVSALTTAATAVMSSVGTIGAAVSSFATSIGPTLVNVVQTVKPLFEVISTFANSLLQSLSILKPGETIESFGVRALQAAAHGITLDSADSFDDYIEKLRNFELDPELEQNCSPLEKLLAGISIATVGVEDKFNAEQGSLNGLWLLPLANPQYFTPERMQCLMTTGRLGSEVLDYLSKALSAGESRNLEKTYEASVVSESAEGAEIDQLYDELHAAQEKWASISKQLENNNQR